MEIFVFGSNLNGWHDGGSARHAFHNCGAVYGQGVGLQGDSYAIPTLDNDMRVMALNSIKPYVGKFIEFAKDNPHLSFNIVAIGCGIAGYTPSQIAPMFKDVPKNCKLPEEFRKVLI